MRIWLCLCGSDQDHLHAVQNETAREYRIGTFTTVSVDVKNARTRERGQSQSTLKQKKEGEHSASVECRVVASGWVNRSKSRKERRGEKYNLHI